MTYRWEHTALDSYFLLDDNRMLIAEVMDTGYVYFYLDTYLGSDYLTSLHWKYDSQEEAMKKVMEAIS